MFLQIVKRIDELKQRLSHLRCQRNDAMTLIAIEAVEQELARTAERLPREWDLVSNGSQGADVNEGVQAGSRWWL
jgi:predicted transcriptional regulator